jgi:alanine racemase
MKSLDLAKKYRTWVEISRQAVEANYSTFRGLISEKTALMAVVKSNAYGHGLTEYTRELEKLGVDWFGVDSTVEAMVLRREGITKPILALGYTLPDKFADVAKLGIHMSVSTFEQLDEIKKARLDTKLHIHIKVDTGMHRQGFVEKDKEQLFRVLAGMEDIVEVAGLFTHFAAAKDPHGPDETKDQIKEFETWQKAFFDTGFSPLCHAGATSGAILYPDAHYDLVRVGIGMYGLWPAQAVKDHAHENIVLTPALSWKTIASEVKELSKGSWVGYDFTEEVVRDSKIAICPVGYWHGYDRAFSSNAHVLVQGKRAKIVGRVSMGMIVIDVTDIEEVQVGDVVTLLGGDRDGEVSAEELARLAGTINYEIVTSINPRIKREIV